MKNNFISIPLNLKANFSYLEFFLKFSKLNLQNFLQKIFKILTGKDINNYNIKLKFTSKLYMTYIYSILFKNILYDVNFFFFISYIYMNIKPKKQKSVRFSINIKTLIFDKFLGLPMYRKSHSWLCSTGLLFDVKFNLTN